jgi:hypothetical protein
MPESGRWTEERIAQLLATSDAAVERAVLRILNWRVQTGQQLNTNDPGKGYFSDSNLFLSLTERILTRQAQQVPAGERLSPKQVAFARQRLRKFIPALTEMANKPKPVRESEQVQGRESRQEPRAAPRPEPISLGPDPNAWKTMRVPTVPLELSEV